DLKKNEIAVIKKINTHKHIKERLHSFGLIRGVEIEFIKKSPMGCPKIYRCLDTTIAIRNKIAKSIQITYEK
ncbi:MAG: FeoA family protein, partial [Patescibacteria group bacterium]|nr:FeoA family protein [Patescibacteria group bacterium]